MGKINFQHAMKAVKIKEAMKAMRIKLAALAIKAMKANKAKKLAPAWVSGGSSSRPRLGKPLKGKTIKEKGLRGPQQAAKKGTALLKSRKSKLPVKRSVPYVPVHQQSGDPRRETRKTTEKAETKLQTLLNMKELALIKMMWRQGHLDKMKVCPKCKKGKLGILKKHKGVYKQRCGRKACNLLIVPHFGSPVFTVGRGNRFIPLSKQAGILFCAVWGVQQSMVPALIEDVGHKRVDEVYKSWRNVAKNYVKGVQAKTKFGTPGGGAQPHDEYEVDEAVVRKEDIEDNQVQWQEVVGLKRRGDRKSLVVHKRAASKSVSSRAENGRAVPPPQSKEEWNKLRKKHVGHNALCHPDGAPAYKAQDKAKGQLHDSVSHSGKNKAYTKVTTHVDAEGEEFKSVAGTQSLDGWWTHAKRATHGVNARYAGQVEAHIHTEQWQHWEGNDDRWVAAGVVLSWIPE